MRKHVLPDRPIWPSVPSSSDPVSTDERQSDVPLEPINVRSPANEVSQNRTSPPRSPADLEVFGSLSI